MYNTTCKTQLIERQERIDMETNTNIVIDVVTFNYLGLVCPTQFEFTDKQGVQFYFRLRHGIARLDNVTSGETILTGSMGNNFDGVCTTEDMVNWAARNNIYIRLN